MKIYLLSQDDNNDYDTYDSIIVCAENEQDARTIAPNGEVFIEKEGVGYTSWARKAENIKCEEIGTANENQKRGVVLSSFNAG